MTDQTEEGYSNVSTSEYEILEEDRLTMFRSLLRSKGLCGYILYRRDPHLNEYVHPHYEHIAWLSGFTGSNSTLLVLPEVAYLYTDSRYFLQAKQQLPRNIELSRMGIDPTVSERLIEFKCTVGVDPSVITSDEYTRLFKKLPEGVDIVLLEDDIIKEMWADRPEIVPGNLEIMKHQRPVDAKIKEIREEMKKNTDMYSYMPPLDVAIIADMDEIAWATNLRGTDIPMSRLFYSFLAIEKDDVFLFTESSLTQDISSVKVRPYAEFYQYTAELKDKIIGISSSTNYKILNSIINSNKVSTFTGILNLKAVKTEEEIQGFIEANKRDAVYLCMLFGEVQKIVSEGKREIGELDVSEMLLKIKEKDREFIVPSFETISGFGENGACIHYAPVDNATKITEDNLLLVDSGSQYTMGTTDITRTVCFGKPTDEQKRDYTALIKGHMDLETTPFSSKTALGALSPIVRKHVWKHYLEYGHSTGHGVGFGLNVHEGPQTLDSSSRVKALPGMNITVEPGIYREGKYGIRHENLAVVQKSKVNPEEFYVIKNITHAPLHLDLVDVEMLSDEEVQYINDQSKYIRELLGESLMHHKEGTKWLLKNTEKISKRKNKK
ncbi:Xaa-Pro aminopeptidase [Nematocida minor]|uniref:Xaa-Pro aminopeptidase n=1 Tax=Nematocida minor TaxID=1912983 RepID=UPI0022211475|nr:Xaa-Pro aminopeptidase [Nematocida minor]KAI5190069.1 Xaa-Pro aminopeptidase [Nematocida minor]